MPLLALVPLILWLALGRAGAAADLALVLRVEGGIGPATAEYVAHGIDAARERGARLVVLELDTPGGLDTAMREIIKAILASPVPVVAYVTPSGARAASVGTYILYAAHVAAMAPGTNLGAATPVNLGEPDEGDGGTEGSRAPGMKEKMVNDAVAYIRSLAELRGRNAEWAEQAVRGAASLSAAAALREGVVDLVAAGRGELLEALDGRAVRVAGAEVRLDTAGLEVERLEPNWRTRLLALVTDPTVAYVLMLLGIYGIVFELYSPGLVGPGLFGAICLLLAFYAFQVLPVDTTGLALLLLGLGLIAAELFVPSFGVLGVAGLVAFVAGSIMLFDTDVPGFGVAWQLVTTISAFAGLTLLAGVVLVARSRRRAVVTGGEQLLHERGEVTAWDGGRGWIRVHGERWEARGSPDLKPGDAVKVRARRGLVLEVEPEEGPR
ncbi:MAG TPA: nodulation protein NfeD [Geminicoccaceae bacterium]|nr:nodulation protein NfeD [Geminicoccaceae bacterium]